MQHLPRPGVGNCGGDLDALSRASSGMYCPVPGMRAKRAFASTYSGEPRAHDGAYQAVCLTGRAWPTHMRPSSMLTA